VDWIGAFEDGMLAGAGSGEVIVVVVAVWAGVEAGVVEACGADSLAMGRRLRRGEAGNEDHGQFDASVFKYLEDAHAYSYDAGVSQ
jgi:hypothetical protein